MDHWFTGSLVFEWNRPHNSGGLSRMRGPLASPPRFADNAATNLENPPRGHREAQLNPFAFEHHDLSETKVAGDDEVATCPYDSPPRHIGRTLPERTANRQGRPVRLPQRCRDIAIRGDLARRDLSHMRSDSLLEIGRCHWELPPDRGERVSGKIEPLC